MYRFIKNHYTISILMGILFAVAFSSGLFISNNISFAQKATTPLSTDNSFDNSTIPTTNTTTAITTASNGAQNQPAAASNKMVQFNHYENNEIGISLKYPSNFLIDESNSNNTLRQISFYPTNSAPISSIPEQYILWMDVFVQNHGNQQQHPLLSLSQRLSSSLSSSLQVSKPDLASYSINLANSIQQSNKDVSIIGSYSNVTLSGYPAYKLITKSFIGNTAIIDVLISAAVNNTIYSVDFQTNSSNYSNSIPDTNKIIQSFKIISPASLASATTTTTMNPSSPPQPPLSSSSSSSSSLSQSSASPASTSTLPNSPLPPQQQSENSKTKPSSSALIPSLSSILSDLQLNDIANNSTHLLKTLKNTVTNSMNDVLSNPQNALDNSIKGTTSLIPTTPSELTSLPSTALKKACGLPFVSGVCNEIGNSLINKNQNPNIEKSVGNGSTNNLSSNNNISNNAAIKRGNEGISNGTIVGTNVNRGEGSSNGESSINNGNVTGNIKLNNDNNSSGSIINNNGISDNSKRNSLIKSLENLFSANTNNNTNQSLLSSNSSALGSGLSFLQKLLVHLTPSSIITKTPNNTSSVPAISSLNSSILAATNGMANQSNSSIAHPPSSSSSSLPPSSQQQQQQSSSTYIPPPTH